jgi:hypothetical protein
VNWVIETSGHLVIDCEESTVRIMRPVHGAAIDWITDALLRSSTGGGATPQALSFLLRRYAATGRVDLGEAIGSALAVALDRMADATGDLPGDDRDDWLRLFVEASGFSDDERLIDAACALVAAISSRWPSRGGVARALGAIDACVSATRIECLHGTAAAAIDELERVIGIAYTPGHELARTLDGAIHEAGRLGDHVSAASALLTAYAITGRLPYSMMAEELTQAALRRWWDEDRGRFNGSFAGNAEAARVLSRLAALHGDEAYRRSAVIAAESDYGRDANRALQALEPEYQGAGMDAAVYGLALIEYQSTR